MRIIYRYCWPAAFLGTFLFGSCSAPEQSALQKHQFLNIVATTGMIADAVVNIAGDSVKVQALMGPGVDPHLYKATQGDLKTLTGADVVLYNGLHLEGKMGEVLEKLSRIKIVVAVAAEIDSSRLLGSPTYKDAFDPHIWFDVSLWKSAVEAVNKTLQAHDPQRAVYYEKNAQKYLQQLDSLHQAVKTEIATIPREQRVLITAHDAFEYFGRAYDIEVRGLQGLSTVSEFGLKDVTDLVDFIIKRNIKAVFVETSISQRSIQAVVEGCQKKGHPVVIGGSLFSDAMGAANTPKGTYIGMVHANVETITQALK